MRTIDHKSKEAARLSFNLVALGGSSSSPPFVPRDLTVVIWTARPVELENHSVNTRLAQPCFVSAEGYLSESSHERASHLDSSMEKRPF